MSSEQSMAKSRVTAENELGEALKKFEKDYLGRGMLPVKVHFWEELAIVRLYNVLTPAEQKLAEERSGQALIKETRRKLFETARPLVERIVEDVLGCRLLSMHTDISTRSGERIIVLTVDANLQERFPHDADRAGNEERKAESDGVVV